MNNEIFTSLIAIALVQGALQTIALFTAKRCNRRANMTMGIFILSCSLISFDCYLHYTERIYNFPHLVRVFTPLYTFVGIIPFYYARCLTDKNFTYSFKNLLHFWPTLAAIAAFFPIYFMPVDQKAIYALGTQDHVWRAIIVILINLSNIGYLAYGFFSLRKYHKAIENHYSNLSQLQLKWLEKVFLLIATLVVSSFTISLVTSSGGFKATYLTLFFSTFLMLMFTGYSALKQIDPLFFLIDDVRGELKKKDLQSKKEISNDQRISAKKKIELLITEKVYLDPDLKLSTLAEKANHPSYLISHVLNNEYEMTFFEFINTYRVEEAKRRLLNNEFQHLTILAIAEDVGFSSKSSFNATFKKLVGKTPSQFRSANSPI